MFHQNSIYAPRGLKFYLYRSHNIMEKISSREKNLGGCFWLTIRKQLVKKHSSVWTHWTRRRLVNLILSVLLKIPFLRRKQWPSIIKIIQLLRHSLILLLKINLIHKVAVNALNSLIRVKFMLLTMQINLILISITIKTSWALKLRETLEHQVAPLHPAMVSYLSSAKTSMTSLISKKESSHHMPRTDSFLKTLKVVL